jgi:hypothetical protein
MKKILASLALTALTTLGCLTIPNDAFAQDTETLKPNVNLTAPDGWDNKNDETKNNLIAVYVDPKSEHRIEVMARRNTSPKHAKVLFEAFHTELKKTFTPQKDETEQSYQLKDGSTRKGQYITYETRDADVPISVITYAFVTDKEDTENHNIDNIAYIVVGYFANAKREEGQKVFESFIQSMTDI